jgi:hypothetical protein
MRVDTIDSIKRRMIRNASKIWGYPDVQDINSFDPVLGLIIGALAEEMHAVSQEINQADARVIGKLLDLLFNQNVFTHFPAHAVACAKPMQPRVSVNDFYQFYYTKNIHRTETGEDKTEKKNIYFSPSTNCTLLDGEIKYLFAGKYLYEIDGGLKEIIAETPKASGGNMKLLLGIQLDPLIEFLDGLSLFFLFKNIQTDDRFYHTLHTAKWKINGKEVIFHSGMETGSANSENSLTSMMKMDSDISYRTSSFINEFYNKKFMTLDNGSYRQKDFLQDNDNKPQILQDYFQNQKLTVFGKDIFWVEIDLSQPLSFEEINDLLVSMNSFPVVNKELNEYTHSIVKGTNVIPLLTDDLFFDIRRVTNSADEVYIPLSSHVNGAREKNTYHIRQGGIARFDSRSAKETIKHLIDLVRDEAAAFSIKGTDLISYELKQLDQILTRLEQRIGQAGIADDLNSYLLLNAETDYDKIHVQFWSISGEIANNIRPGSKLSVYSGTDIDDKKVSLLTQSVGGRQKLSKEDKLNTFRRLLLSKGRIVTKEDMKALCIDLFGDNLKNVEVKKGVNIERLPGKGMGRTLDIFLYLNENNELTPEEVWYKTESLKVRLHKDSVNLMPYRVFVK